MAFVGPTTWRTWKALCSVAACEPEQRTELYSVISSNLRRALRQWERNLPHYSDAELAQFFDEHFKLGYAGPDARNKDYIFLRFAHIADEAEWAKRITVYIRIMASWPKSVAEPLARREGRTGPIVPDLSAEELVGPETWLDASVRPDVLAGEADLQALAGRLAKGIFLGLDDVHRAALWSIANDRTLTDSEVLRLAGRGKSSVAQARKKLPDLIKTQINRFCLTETHEVMEALAVEIAKAMLPLAIKWGTSGNTVA